MPPRPLHRSSMVVCGIALLSAALLFVFGIGELAFGYTYVLTRRGSTFISGTGTLVIAGGVLLLGVACLLTIADHVDPRGEAGRWRKAQGWCSKAGLAALICMPLVVLGTWALHEFAQIDVPRYHGFANETPLSFPALTHAAPRLSSWFDADLRIAILIGGVITLAVAWACMKRKIVGVSQRVQAAIGGVGLLLMALSFAMSIVVDLASGTTTTHDGGERRVVSAIAEPGKFGAAMLLESVVSGAIFLAGAGSLAVALTLRSDEA